MAGIEFSSKVVLRFGVALLGARITASQILELGFMPIATVVGRLASTIALGSFIGKRLGLSRSFGVLSGGAAGETVRSVAAALWVGVSSVVTWSQRYRATGSAVPGKLGAIGRAF